MCCPVLSSPAGQQARPPWPQDGKRGTKKAISSRMSLEVEPEFQVWPELRSKQVLGSQVRAAGSGLTQEEQAVAFLDSGVPWVGPGAILTTSQVSA